MEWIKAENRPEKSGYYLIHIYFSGVISFRGLDKSNYKDSEFAHIGDVEEFVTMAYYSKNNDRWTYSSDDCPEEEIYGIYKTLDWMDAVGQTRIIEWQPLPSYTPVKNPYNPLEREPNVVGNEEGFAENKKFAELIRFRFDCNKTLDKCAYKKMGYGEDADSFLNIDTTEQFYAMLSYFTVSETDKDTGEVLYKKPEIISSSRDMTGLYKIRLQDGRFIITHMTDVKEMFEGLK